MAFCILFFTFLSNLGNFDRFLQFSKKYSTSDRWLTNRIKKLYKWSQVYHFVLGRLCLWKDASNSLWLACDVPALVPRVGSWVVGMTCADKHIPFLESFCANTHKSPFAWMPPPPPTELSYCERIHRPLLHGQKLAFQRLTKMLNFSEDVCDHN